jgi:hypothetical protein
VARTITVAQLMTRIRNASDETGSKFIDDDELIEYIDMAYAEMYDLIVDTYQDYKVTFANFTTTSDVNIYQLPTNCYKVRGLDCSNGISAKAFMFEERERLANSTYYNDGLASNLRYCVLGDTLLLLPTPAEESLTLWFVPAPARITADTQIIDGIAGFEQYIIAHACIEIANKNETDPAVFERKLARLEKKITSFAFNRDAGEPRQVIDARNFNIDPVY